MGTYFFDTSALVKLYHQEAGTDKVEGVYSRENNQIYISELGVVELHSALAQKIRMKELDKQRMEKALEAFYNDCLEEGLKVISMNYSHYGTAIDLILKHGKAIRLRTLDALQLAVARELKEQKHGLCFVCADDKLSELAKIIGLNFINPERDR